jgi:ubiquitin-conjugating enzyme E2 R
MLGDPNTSSPANVDASVEFRQNRKKYKQRVLDLVKKSQKEIPEDFISSRQLVQSMKKKTPMQSPQFDLDFVEDDYIYDPDDEDEYQIDDNQYDPDEEILEEDEEDEKVEEKIET